jgi:DNA segregation ATPase FtsK/SpoIIIE-like protein
MVTTDLKIKCENQNQQVHIAPIRAVYNELPESDAPICPESNENNGKVYDREPLYADALVVITEFGHASAAILQMWLSIDYGRAIKILDQFQADGLISSKGRVRHKAFVLRHSLAS